MRSVVPFFAVNLALLLNVFGCTASRGIDRQALLESIHHGPGVRNESVASTLTPESRLPTPYRLAIFFQHKDVPASAQSRSVGWTGADAKLIQEALAPLKELDIVHESFLLVNSSVQGPALRDIRSAAARYNADAILVIDGASTVDRYNNRRAWWYITGFGAYLAPGTESHALFIMEGTVLDVWSGRLYGTQQAEGEITLVGPAVSLEDRAAIAQAKDVALERFGKAIVEALRRLNEKQRNSN